MNWNEFYASLKANELKPVYLFAGPEVFIKSGALEAMRKKLLPEGLEGLNESVLEGATAAQIIEAAETLPMMCDRRLVIVRDWAPLMSGKSKNEEEEAERRAQAEEQANAQRFFIWRFFDKRAVPAAIVTILVTISTVSITTFVTPYGIEIGLSGIGTFFTAQAITMIFARLASGKLQRRLGRFKTMLLGLACDIVALVLLATMTNNAMMYGAAIMRGWGGGLYFPLLNVLSVENASRSGRGKAVSTYYAAYDLGAGVGAAIWGVVADMFGKVSMATGYRALFAGAALFYVVIVPMTYLLLRNVDQPKKA